MRMPRRGLLAAGLMLFACAAWAAGPAADSPSSGQDSVPDSSPRLASPGAGARPGQVLQAKWFKLIHLQRQLHSIEQSTLEADPALKKKNSDYRQLLMETMKRGGYDAEAGLKKIQDLQAELKDPTLDPQRRSSLQQMVKEEDRVLQAARDKALDEPKVKKAREALQSELTEAMKARDPKVESLMKELHRTEVEYRMLSESMPKDEGAAERRAPFHGM